MHRKEWFKFRRKPHPVLYYDWFASPDHEGMAKNEVNISMSAKGAKRIAIYKTRVGCDTIFQWSNHTSFISYIYIYIYRVINSAEFCDYLVPQYKPNSKMLLYGHGNKPTSLLLEFLSKAAGCDSFFCCSCFICSYSCHWPGAVPKDHHNIHRFKLVLPYITLPEFYLLIVNRSWKEIYCIRQYRQNGRDRRYRLQRTKCANTSSSFGRNQKCGIISKTSDEGSHALFPVYSKDLITACRPIYIYIFFLYFIFYILYFIFIYFIFYILYFIFIVIFSVNIGQDVDVLHS